MKVVHLQPVQRGLFGPDPERSGQSDAKDHRRHCLQPLRHSLDQSRVRSHMVGAVQANVGHTQIEFTPPQRNCRRMRSPLSRPGVVEPAADCRSNETAQRSDSPAQVHAIGTRREQQVLAEISRSVGLASLLSKDQNSSADMSPGHEPAPMNR